MDHNNIRPFIIFILVFVDMLRFTALTTYLILLRFEKKMLIYYVNAILNAQRVTIYPTHTKLHIICCFFAVGV